MIGTMIACASGVMSVVIPASRFETKSPRPLGLPRTCTVHFLASTTARKINPTAITPMPPGEAYQGAAGATGVAGLRSPVVMPCATEPKKAEYQGWLEAFALPEDLPLELPPPLLEPEVVPLEDEYC